MTSTFLAPTEGHDSSTNILTDKKIFISPDENEFDDLEKALERRLAEGQEAQKPGLTADEMEASVATLELLGERLNVSVVFLRDSNGAVPTVNEDVQKKSKSKSSNQPKTKMSNDDFKASLIKSVQPDSQTGLIVKEFLLRRTAEEQDFVDVRVAVVGNVDAGKSTLLGVLTHGELDNGRGLARLRLFRHKHEMESGRTSSVGNDILGFSSDGGIVNKPVHGQLDWSTICKESAKVVTFIDLAGHERYLKTTVFGMTGHAPDFAMLMVGANAGIIGMTKEHLGLALALTVPVFVVVTKIDMCPPNVLQDTMNLLFKILKSPGCRKLPILVNNHDDVIISATNFTSQRMCPIFAVSNVTGENLDLVKKFINLLTPRSDPQFSKPPEYQIDEVYTVQGVGTVVSGTCLCGEIKVNENMLLGPDPTGNYALVPIKSIHRKRLPVLKVAGGQTASFALKKVKRNQLRKGMVLISPSLEPFCCLIFQAEVLILHHPTTIWVGYQAMVHAGPVRQTATIISISSKDRLRTGDKDIVTFKFIRQPEFLKKGIRLIFREGKTKAVGTVTEVTPFMPKAVGQAKIKQMKKTVRKIREEDPSNEDAAKENAPAVSTLDNEATPVTSAVPVADRITDISKLTSSNRRQRKAPKNVH